MSIAACTSHGACGGHHHAHAPHAHPAKAPAAPHAHRCQGDTHTHPSPKTAPKPKSYIDVLADHPAVKVLQVGTGLLMVPMVPVMVYALYATVRAATREPAVR